MVKGNCRGSQASTTDWEKENQPLNKRKATRKNKANFVLNIFIDVVLYLIYETFILMWFVYMFVKENNECL